MDFSSVKFNGKNYLIWEFQFCYFVAGKGLSSYLNGSAAKPIAPTKPIAQVASSTSADEDSATVAAACAAAVAAAEAKHTAAVAAFVKDLETWNLNNARVFSWLINSVETKIALTLRKFDSAAAIWTHLEKVMQRLAPLGYLS
ncbi:hypothetical protein LINGRAHAP2_LOCUS883 [Linum grandiflorum]